MKRNLNSKAKPSRNCVVQLATILSKLLEEAEKKFELMNKLTNEKKNKQKHPKSHKYLCRFQYFMKIRSQTG